jgi:hypothetical protein
MNVGRYPTGSRAVSVLVQASEAEELPVLKMTRKPGISCRPCRPFTSSCKNGHVTLKGVVRSAMDSQLAYMAASSVPNVFDAKNELSIEATQKAK